MFSKIDRDKAFAARVAAASPHISKWYIASSVILLGVVTLVRLVVR